MLNALLETAVFDVKKHPGESCHRLSWPTPAQYRQLQTVVLTHPEVSWHL